MKSRAQPVVPFTKIISVIVFVDVKYTIYNLVIFMITNSEQFRHFSVVGIIVNIVLKYSRLFQWKSTFKGYL